MNLKLKKFLKTEISITDKLKLTPLDLIAFTLISVCCILMRTAMFSYVSGDYGSFLSKWFDTLQENGGFAALGMSLGDYTPPYFYILAALTYLPINSLFSIKLVSCFFDFVLAIYIMKMVFFKYKSVPISIFSYGAVLAAPTVLLNSACWAQCDVIFTLFLLLCVFSFMKDKPLLACIFFGISFSFKLQAIFLAPLLLIFWLNGKMKFRHFFAIPAVYLISIIPAALAGRSLFELLTIYISQSGQYKRMSLSAPSIYIFISDMTNTAVATAAVLICFVAVLTAIYLICRKKFEFTNEIIITMALFFSLLVPFLLPYMHERYFYSADILSIVFAFYRPKKFFIAIMISFASLCCYMPFLFGKQPVNLNITAIIMLFALIFIVIELKKLLFTTKIQKI